MCGIGLEHFKLLCENPFNGGLGYTPAQVGEMTLDMVLFLLTQPNSKKQEIAIEDATALADRDGVVKGRDADGNPIAAKWDGMSLVQKIRAGLVAPDETSLAESMPDGQTVYERTKETRKGRRQRKRRKP